MSKIDTGEAWFGAPVAALQPLDPDNAAAELRDLAETADEHGLKRLKKLATVQSPLASFLGAVFDLSPFMRDSARRRPEA